MFWNKKEDARGLPDLPPSKEPLRMHLIEEDENENDIPEKHGLPSFPDSPIQKGFSQTAIREAVINESTEDEVGVPFGDESAFKTIEMNDWKNPTTEQRLSPPEQRPTLPEIPKSLPTPLSRVIESPINTKIMESPRSAIIPRPTARNSDVFIKIDKFYSSKRALENISEKIEEIDNILKKIRETKIREEQEMSAWEKEIVSIKSRIKEVTETIFEKQE